MELVADAVGQATVEKILTTGTRESAQDRMATLGAWGPANPWER